MLCGCMSCIDMQSEAVAEEAVMSKAMNKSAMCCVVAEVQVLAQCLFSISKCADWVLPTLSAARTNPESFLAPLILRSPPSPPPPPH